MHPKKKPKQFSCVLYIFIFFMLYIIYLIMSRPTKPPNFDGGPVPNMDDGEDVDDYRGVAAILPMSRPNPVVAQVDTKELEEERSHKGFTDQQREILLTRLSSMERLVHLDLKGAAPKMSYIAKIFPLFKTLGATGLLIEWEDMFPYSGDLETLSALDCYTKEDVKEIHRLAKANGLFIIPLIQTFGHMEFVLKGPKFKHLRENPRQPQVINPHKDESIKLIQGMIDQQMDLQPDIEYIHVGCDEVWGLGNSNESKKLLHDFGTSKDTMFLMHVREVAGYVKNKYPLTEVLMWDDMFRSTSSSDIEKSNISKLVSPVIWMYHPDTDKKLRPSLFTKYSRLFHNVWIATAFKGATGSDQYITAIDNHYENHMAWLRILVSPSASVLNVKGTILTGWQRYDHFASLCELLPVAIPSLGVCLSTLKHAGLSAAERTSIDRTLGCHMKSSIQWHINPKDDVPPVCSYPGHELLQGIYALKSSQYYFSYSESKQGLSGWHKEYNINRKFSQTFRMQNLKDKCSLASKAIIKAEKVMKESLPKYFSEETTMEWLETYVKPLKKTIHDKLTQAENALKWDTWPRRPIHKLIYS